MPQWMAAKVEANMTTSGMAPKAPSVPQKPEVSINGHLHRRGDPRMISEACSCGWEPDGLGWRSNWYGHVIVAIAQAEDDWEKEAKRCGLT